MDIDWTKVGIVAFIVLAVLETIGSVLLIDEPRKPLSRGQVVAILASNFILVAILIQAFQRI